MERQKSVRGAAPKDRTDPFFLYLPLSGPHTPWMPTSEFHGKTSIGDYGDFVLQIDHVVGEVVNTLKQIGEWDNTILIFTSDNGAYWPEEEIALQNHDSNEGRRGQKGDIWDGGHRIPLVISWPNIIKNPVVYYGLTSLTDLYATFCEFFNQKMKRDEGEDSQSLLPLFQNENITSHRASMIHQSSRGLFAYREGDWKYIDGLGSGGFTEPTHVDQDKEGPKGQLYHMDKDPMESRNLYLMDINKASQLKKALDKQKR